MKLQRLEEYKIIPHTWGHGSPSLSIAAKRAKTYAVEAEFNDDDFFS